MPSSLRRRVATRAPSLCDGEVTMPESTKLAFLDVCRSISRTMSLILGANGGRVTGGEVEGGPPCLQLPLEH